MPGRPKKITEEKVKEIVLRYNEVKNFNTVSKEFGLSRSTIRYYIHGDTRDKKATDKNSKAVSKRRKLIKEMAIEYKGGKCCNCGYDKCARALHFHHLDPNEKDFGIGGNGRTRSWEKVKEELDKCVLVCSNCHAEIHEGILKILV